MQPFSDTALAGVWGEIFALVVILAHRIPYFRRRTKATHHISDKASLGTVAVS